MRMSFCAVYMQYRVDNNVSTVCSITATHMLLPTPSGVEAGRSAEQAVTLSSKQVGASVVCCCGDKRCPAHERTLIQNMART